MLPTVTSALITSHLDSCKIPSMGLPLKSFWKLPLVQNALGAALIANWLAGVIQGTFLLENTANVMFHFRHKNL